MIQRIQSVWLLLAALCAAFTYKISFYSGNKLGMDNKPVFEKLTASSNFILLITTAILLAGCLYIIFLYKNRKQQLWLTIGATTLAVINLIIYFAETKKFLQSESNYGLGAVFALAIPILLILAASGIWKDEKLVKSVNRLR
jgi:drug/metabolite transporter superfamily protein YnfA